MTDDWIKLLTRFASSERGIEVTPDEMKLQIGKIVERIKNLATKCGIDVSKVDDLKLLTFVVRILKEDF